GAGGDGGRVGFVSGLPGRVGGGGLVGEEERVGEWRGRFCARIPMFSTSQLREIYMTTVEYFAIARDIIISVAAIFTAGVAASGLHRWKSELVGKKNFEVARALVRAALKVRDVIAACRAPGSAGEYPENYELTMPLNQKEHAKALRHVYENRLKRMWAAVQEFDATVWEAEALWGGEIKCRAKAIHSCAWELHHATQHYLENEESGGKNFKENEQFGEEVDCIVVPFRTLPRFFEGVDVGKEFSKKVEKAVAEIKRCAHPYMRT
ncbi:MAG: hypothetical protein MPL62_12490, partial [Alphaproteobacteria bacterium]|nr:hypothetical protein [Alphaproteobacteria bacterium]